MAVSEHGKNPAIQLLNNFGYFLDDLFQKFGVWLFDRCQNVDLKFEASQD